jgi:hypothetical protein
MRMRTCTIAIAEKMLLLTQIHWFSSIKQDHRLRSEKIVGILGSCASMRNAPDLRIPGTFLTLIVSLHSSGCFTLIPFYFVVYSIYTRSCIVVTYPFASVPPRDNRKSILFCLDHANDLRLTI